VGLAYGFFTFDFLFGQTNRAVEGQDSVTVNNVFTSQVNGVYTENVTAYRPGFRFGENVSWNLNLINSKEDGESIQYGGNVKEALVVGTDLSMNFDDRRVMFEGSLQASIQNTNAGGPEVESLADIDSSLVDNEAAKQAFDLLKSTGFLSITPGLSPLPSLAMQFDLYLRYFNNNLKFTYLNIERDFASPGNPYLLKDRSGFFVNDNIRLFQSQVFLNLFFKTYSNNLSNEDYSTSNTELGSTISYFPTGNYPSLVLGYTSYNRSNGVTATDTVSMPYLYIEDNATQQITFSTSYDLNFDKIKNTFIFNIFNNIREDAGNKERQSNSNSFTIGVRNTFDFPLTTKLSYTQSSSSIGDVTKIETDVSRINANVDYKFYNLIEDDVLKPFVNISFQNLSGTTSTDRNNYAGGFVYQSPKLGVLSLKYYQVSYVNPVTNKNIDDTILNARYEYLF